MKERIEEVRKRKQELMEEENKVVGFEKEKFTTEEMRAKFDEITKLINEHKRQKIERTVDENTEETTGEPEIKVNLTDITDEEMKDKFKAVAQLIEEFQKTRGK